MSNHPSETKKSKNPLVHQTQNLHKIELEAFDYLGKAVERLDKEILALKERITKLEEGKK